jgi:RNA-directed DNA polymerase
MAERKAPRAERHPSDDSESEAWNRLPWRKFEQHVYRIQKRIYRAKQRGKTRTVHKLQKLLMKSKAAQLLAVRRVTQQNQGKKTAGVDGVKFVTPAQRLVMAKAVHPKHWRHHKPKPVRRVWIPKPGKAEKRPLGIPTMLERAKQALVKSALEPEWEAVFEPNSYGFRPGRSCHDAIAAIYTYIRYKPKYVLDADIKGCFDHINQTALLEKLHTFPAMRQVINTWLKAGVLEGLEFTPTQAGTPQGGVISPLLANIALHGMEEAVKRGDQNGHDVEQPVLIRYADDFVILHSQKEAIDRATQVIEQWLQDMGLHLSPKKTQVTHTYLPTQGNVGFDFLGCAIRQFSVGKTHTGKDTRGRPLGFKTIIKPSREAIKGHLAETKQRIRKRRSNPQGQLIRELNPVIWGWAAYYRTIVSSKAYARCDYFLWNQLMSWCKRRHSNKGTAWVVRKYWSTVGKRHWVFATPEGATLRRHSHMKIRRHPKVKGNASPYDGNLLYWSQRLKEHPLMKEGKAKLLQKQQGKCRWCGLTFRDGDQLETDHIDQDRNNHALSNTMVLHRHCHDERHAKNGAAVEKFERLTGKQRKPKSNQSQEVNQEEPWEEEDRRELVKQDRARLKKLQGEGIHIK